MGAALPDGGGGQLGELLQLLLGGALLLQAREGSAGAMGGRRSVQWISGRQPPAPNKTRPPVFSPLISTEKQWAQSWSELLFGSAPKKQASYSVVI